MPTGGFVLKYASGWTWCGRLIFLGTKHCTKKPTMCLTSHIDTADEQVEAVVELTQSALDSLGLKPGMIKPL